MFSGGNIKNDKCRKVAAAAAACFGTSKGFSETCVGKHGTCNADATGSRHRNSIGGFSEFPVAENSFARLSFSEPRSISYGDRTASVARN